MMPLPVPGGADDLDAEWLGRALEPVADGAQLSSVRRERIGNGMVADSIRLVPVWDRPTSAPGSLVAKVPAPSAASRAAAAATRTYLIEAAFYSELAPSLAVPRPLCHLARYEETTGNYVVLLEDLAPAEPGDQLAGCSPEEAATVMPELATLHGSRWADPALEDLAWLDRPTGESAQAMAQFVGSLFPLFVQTYGARVEPDVLALAERFMGSPGGATGDEGPMARYLGHRPKPWTVVHGDFRLDNLLFGTGRVAVVDWQTVRLSSGLCDTAYFIGSALTPEDRRRHEVDLVRLYHAGLVAAGVELAWDDCWRDYRRYGFDGLLMGVAASVLVQRTERGDAMFVAMVNRHGRQLLDLEAEALIP